jgi:hypothetical protein
MRKVIAIFIILHLSIVCAIAQNNRFKQSLPWLDSIVIYSNQQMFSSNQNVVLFGGKYQLIFEYQLPRQVVKLEIFTKQGADSIVGIISSPDFEVLDSVRFIQDKYVCRIRFVNISLSEFTGIVFQTQSGQLYEVPLLPVCKMEANFFPQGDELFVGESRRFEIITDNIDNLILDRQWRSNDAFDYRLIRIDNSAFIYIEPKKAGEHVFEIELPVRRPIIYDRKVQMQLPALQKKFLIKNTRFTYLRFDTRQIIRNPNQITTTEVTVENNRQLQIGKLYRIESAEDPESPLVAEMLALRRTSNDRILCEMRPYNNHPSGSGSVYIKDGNKLLFLANIEIIPTPSIEKVSVLRNGSEWSDALNIQPGEVYTLRIEGKYIRNSKIEFGALQILSIDSLNSNDRSRTFQIKVPTEIMVRKIPIMLDKTTSGVELNIIEHQTPRPLDFITINYGTGKIALDEINQPILYSHTINDIVIDFDRAKIDRNQNLYGRQHIRVRVRMEDKNGILIENTILGSFMICPDESSPRYAFYTKSGCRLEEIRVNDFMNRKTHVVSEWGKIEVFIEHVSTSYATEGYTKRVTIYQEKRTSFDVDVSVPAGLFVQRLGKDEPIASLTGISFAMIAQFSFYRKSEIQKLLPIKAGVGFLAQNAFNFNSNAKRDLGIIALISVYPIRGTNRISFPLYGGGGYFLQDNKFFALIGPGIRISF